MNLTYLLGAGASANALPIISGMNERMRLFIKHLYKKGNALNSETLAKLYELAAVIEKHYTIDTYARKLYLRNESCQFLNSFLAAYLTYEQMSKEDNLEDQEILNPKTELNKKCNEKIKTTLDYRYDSFFATLLSQNEGKLILPPSANIISWNYDSQIELAYMNYLKKPSLDRAQEILNVFPSNNSRRIEDGKSKVIKLNGYTGFFGNNEDKGQFSYKQLRFSKENAIAMSELFNKKRKPSNNIKFSWIKDKQTDEARKQAQEILRKTKVLVVIGYSFPYFNRVVDKEIFLGFEDKLPTVYLQTRLDDFESIKNRMIGVNNYFEKTKAFTELDQFLIPSEFY